MVHKHLRVDITILINDTVHLTTLKKKPHQGITPWCGLWRIRTQVVLLPSEFFGNMEAGYC